MIRRNCLRVIIAAFAVFLGLLAGLSMGRMQTLNISMSDLGKFSYIGAFSSGIFGPAPKTPAAPGAAAKPTAAAPSPEWEQQHLAMLDNASLKRELKLLWFITGSEDFLVNNQEHRGNAQKARIFPRLQRDRRRPHLNQLAQLSL